MKKPPGDWVNPWRLQYLYRSLIYLLLHVIEPYVSHWRHFCGNVALNVKTDGFIVQGGNNGCPRNFVPNCLEEFLHIHVVVAFIVMVGDKEFWIKELDRDHRVRHLGMGMAPRVCH